MVETLTDIAIDNDVRSVFLVYRWALNGVGPRRVWAPWQRQFAGLSRRLVEAHELL